MLENGDRNILGILGGMGPMASAEFLKTIYEHSLVKCEREQQSPIVIAYSDPTLPDRTEALINGSEEELVEKLGQAIERLIELGASRIVICCVTAHFLLPRLPQNLSARLISLLDVIFARVLQERKKYLLVCSRGARNMELFQRHDRWMRAKDYIVLPDERDQDKIHEMIFEVKLNRSMRKPLSFLNSLLNKYQVNSFIAGCTEIHILAKKFLNDGKNIRYGCVDPLTILARHLTEQNFYGAREYMQAGR